MQADENGNKRCYECKTWKTLDQFHRNKSSGDGRRALCKTCVSAGQKRWPYATSEKGKQRRREYMRRWNADNPGYRKAQQAAWLEANPDKARVLNLRAKVKGWDKKTGNQLSSEDIEIVVAYLLATKDDTCRYCDSAPGEQYDHVIPFARGGTTYWYNIVRACWPCNRDKGTLTGDEFRAVLAFRRQQAA